MAAACTFTSDGKQRAPLEWLGVGAFEASCGRLDGRNNPKAAGWADAGQSPMGRYYIVDEQYVVTRDHISDSFGGKDWASRFALYKDDGTIDGYTLVAKVKRGNFHLHPIG